MADEHQSVSERIVQLREALPAAVTERRRRFLEACTYWALADPDITKGNLGFNEADAAALDRALDLFNLASTMVSEIRAELRDKETVRDMAAKRGLTI